MSDVGELDLNDDRPAYRQVASKLRAAIQESYAQGDRLPAHQDVATQYGVSVGTVKRAFAVLQQDQIIVTRQGQGSFIVRVPGSDEPPEPAGSDVGALRREVERLTGRVAAIERRIGVDHSD